MKVLFFFGLFFWTLLPGAAWAQEAAGPLAQLREAQVALDTLWTLFAAFLVFFMNAGFALLESGLCRSKNTVNILYKNFIVFAVASLAFWAAGFGYMFGEGNALIGLKGFFLSGEDNSPLTGEAYRGVFSSLSWTGIPLYAKFFFQLVFAGTAATIVSGAVAERIKFLSFIIFSWLLVAFLYPVVGHWVWGGGWLARLGFWDFAGSTVVHSVGGWAALAGAIALGPRLGKYSREGKVQPLPGHNMSTATLGAMILWLGWFGFNPGSTMAAQPGEIARIALTTNMAAASGLLMATLMTRLRIGKPDLSMTLNGALAGLVAITAPCAFVSPLSAVIIGAIAGCMAVQGVITLDRFRVDDPVGAITVHLMAGVLGTLSVGLFAQESINPATTGDGLFFGGGASLFLTQLLGVAVVGVFVLGSSFAIWLGLRATLGIRVSTEEEMEGLDLSEHGMEAYAREVIHAPGAHSLGTLQRAIPPQQGGPDYGRR